MLNFFNRLGIRPSKSLEQWIEQTRSCIGYEREAAIHALRSYRDGSAIPCLLVRANDWVPAVRDVARLALEDFLADKFATEWIAALGSLTALQRARRTNHDRLLSAVAVLLGKPRPAHAGWESTTSSSGSWRLRWRIRSTRGRRPTGVSSTSICTMRCCTSTPSLKTGTEEQKKKKRRR